MRTNLRILCVAILVVGAVFLLHGPVAVGDNPALAFDKHVSGTQVAVFEDRLDDLSANLHQLALREAKTTAPFHKFPNREHVWEWRGTSDYYTTPLAVRVTDRSWLNEYIIVSGTVQFIRGGGSEADVRLVVYEFPRYGAPRRVDDEGNVTQLVNGSWVDVGKTLSTQIRAQARSALHSSLTL